MQVLQWLAQLPLASAALATLLFSLLASWLYQLVRRSPRWSASERFVLLAGLQMASVLLFLRCLWLPVNKSLAVLTVNAAWWLNVQAAFALLWLLVAAGKLAQMGWAVQKLQRTIKKQSAQAPRWAKNLLAMASEDLGRVPAELRLLPHASSAAAWGIAKPLVLLPLHWLTQLDEASLRLVLLHELAHLRRNDVVLHLMLSAGAKLLWFSPLNQQMHQWLALERECAVDDAVKQVADPLAYSQTLLRCAREQNASPALAFAQKPLLYRVQRLLDVPVQEKQPSRGKAWWWQAAVVALLAAMHSLAVVQQNEQGAWQSPVMAQASMLFDQSWSDEAAAPTPKAVAQSPIATAMNEPEPVAEPMVESTTGAGYAMVLAANAQAPAQPGCAPNASPKPDSSAQKTFIQIELPRAAHCDSGAGIQKLIIQVDKQVIQRARL